MITVLLIRFLQHAAVQELQTMLQQTVFKLVCNMTHHWASSSDCRRADVRQYNYSADSKASRLNCKTYEWVDQLWSLTCAWKSASFPGSSLQQTASVSRYRINVSMTFSLGLG